MISTFSLNVAGLPAGSEANKQLPYENMLFVSKNKYSELQKQNGGTEPVRILIKKFILTLGKHSEVSDESIGVGKVQREMLDLASIDQAEFTIAFIKKEDISIINHMNIDVDVLQRQMGGDARIEIEEKEFETFLQKLNTKHLFNKNQIFVANIKGNIVTLRVTGLQLVEETLKAGTNAKRTFGALDGETEFTFGVNPKHAQTFRIKSSKLKENIIFKQNFNFEELGIGGLDKEFGNIFRRAFNSRRYPAEFLEKYGIKHVKGMLLYGPPGTGKTLIARQIAKALDAYEPKIVNGPEIFDKFVGKSEENIRNLFADAEKEQKLRGDDSKLHIIIFDEIDAICKPRGAVSSGTGVHDSVVNQLLSKLDGVDSLNNILVIGMTNRKDMLDEAVLRPGRLEVHVEIGLPEEPGRVQIFNIHTRKMREHKLLAPDVSIEKLAKVTKNYTGAEIESVVKSATSYSLFKGTDMKNLGKASELQYKVVTSDDFDHALQECKPQFGADSLAIDNMIRGGMIMYGKKFQETHDTCMAMINQIKNSDKTPLLSVLLEGERGTGKTAIAAYLAKNSGFPFVKLITPEALVGYTEVGKVGLITKIFEDSYKSPLSLIILDDIERLIEFIHIGPRFSNLILQCLLVLIKKNPPNENRKLLIIGTTGLESIMREMEVVRAFNVCLNLPQLKQSSDISNVLATFKGTPEKEIAKIAGAIPQIGIKDLLLISEMAIQKNPNKALDFASFMDCIKNTSHLMLNEQF